MTTLTIAVHVRWWFTPVVRMCLLWSRMTGWQPSEATIARIVNRALTIKQ